MLIYSCPYVHAVVGLRDCKTKLVSYLVVCCISTIVLITKNLGMNLCAFQRLILSALMTRFLRRDLLLKLHTGRVNKESKALLSAIILSTDHDE
jgi:hypothetical protein